MTSTTTSTASRRLTGNDFKSRGSKHGWWVVAQQQVTSHNGDASRGLSLFANLTVHDKATNVVDNYQQLGVVYRVRSMRGRRTTSAWASRASTSTTM